MAPEGTRNDTLNRAAFGLGQLVAAGLLPAQDVTTTLAEATARGPARGRSEPDGPFRDDRRGALPAAGDPPRPAAGAPRTQAQDSGARAAQVTRRGLDPGRVMTGGTPIGGQGAWLSVEAPRIVLDNRNGEPAACDRPGRVDLALTRPRGDLALERVGADFGRPAAAAIPGHLR